MKQATRLFLDLTALKMTTKNPYSNASGREDWLLFPMFTGL